MLDTALDFMCGCFSGLAQVFFMQPFQLVKVRLINQNSLQPYYNGMFDCFGKISREEGFLAFYKGSLVPFIGVGVQVAMQFGPNEIVKRAMKALVEDQDQQNNDDQTNNILTMQLVFLAGLLTGIPSALTVTPIDLTRILLQNQKGDDHHNKYHGSIDAGVKIYRQYGIKGLYQGLNPSLLREVVALPIYFSTYQKVMRTIADDENSQAPVLASFFVGGFSGMLSWLFSYPIDYVKTLIQSDNPQSKKYSSAIECAKIKYRQQGIRTFFKGLGVTLFRSFPVNGVGFFSFQLAMRLTGRKQIFEDDEFQEIY